jgi:hypothetical protein
MILVRRDDAKRIAGRTNDAPGFRREYAGQSRNYRTLAAAVDS